MEIKVCGLASQEDVEAVARLGAKFCGFIFHPASPRALDPKTASGLESGALARVGVFVEQGADEIITIMKQARLDYAQLHGSQSLACAERIGPERVIRVLWPARFHHLEELERQMAIHARACAWFLLDAGKAGGGSGQVLNWSWLSGLRSPRPWLLAGGLTPDNAARAAASCQPDGLDFNSGVEEAPGKKSRQLLAALHTALGGELGERK